MLTVHQQITVDDEKNLVHLRCTMISEYTSQTKKLAGIFSVNSSHVKLLITNSNFPREILNQNFPYFFN